MFFHDTRSSRFDDSQDTEYLPVDGYGADSAPSEQDIPGFTPRSAMAPARGGAHRLPTPPSALKGRAAVLAVAAGAVVAAGQAAVSNASGSEHSEVALASDETTTVAATAAPQAAQYTDAPVESAPASTAPQVLNIANPTDLSQFSNLLAKGQRFAEERAAREAAARRPLFVLPTIGTFTSSFGARWGTLHAGVDIAAPIGTPIVAVADGTVIESGPASGFGMWVRLQHDDGTVTVYGHIDQSMVSAGQRVMAGDQIATVGNRGFSTGPHLHFEVHLNGSDKVDPLPWLASRGISLGVERD
nr:M23 family metallopeptidase [Rhodococcus triatomae]